MAASYHGHSAKRFILNVVEASPLFTKEEEGEVGRFSGSTAQQMNDLTPIQFQSMLHAHTLSVAVLPEIYGSLVKVSKVHDVLCSAHRVMADALIDASEGGHELPIDGSRRSPYFH